MSKYIKVESEIDITDYIDEIPTEILKKELFKRNPNDFDVNKFLEMSIFGNNQKEFRIFICKCLGMRDFQFSDKKLLLSRIEELF